MKTFTIFEIYFIIFFILGSIVRAIGIFGKKPKKFKGNIDEALLIFVAVGMFILPIMYFSTWWLFFANYTIPSWLSWIGVLSFIMAIWMLWRSHLDLGRNWSPLLEIQENHILVTTGVYKYMRHPMYVAHIFWAIAQGLLLSNWLAGWSFLFFQIFFYWNRIPKEEKMMIEKFGKEYIDYKKKTLF